MNVPEYNLLKCFNEQFDDTVKQILGLYNPERHFINCNLCGRPQNIKHCGVNMVTGKPECKQCVSDTAFDTKYFVGLQVACGKRDIQLSENMLFFRNRKNKLLKLNNESNIRQHWCCLLIANNDLC